jgi:serine/threonine protein kinase
MGVIYDARDLKCAGNRVLIKTTRYDGGENARRFAYSQDEATAHIARLRAILEWEKKVLVRFKKERINNIPSPNDFFQDRSLLLRSSYAGKHSQYDIPSEVLDTEPYLVMERIHGDTLEGLIGTEKFRAGREKRLLHLAKEILTIFIRMHRRFEVGGQEAYFIYQDLKPANILVSGADYFTLIDLGGVTLRLGEKTTEPTAGMITYGYAPPEAERDGGVRIDHRFDIYTLGATVWHAFTESDPRDLAGNFPRLDPRLLAGVASPNTIEIIARALAPTPKDRYGHAAEMRKDVMATLRAMGEPV